MRQRSGLGFYTFYNTLILPLQPGLAGYTLWRRYRQGKSAAALRGQWGHVPAEVVKALHPPGKPQAPVIWVHAVSVGETMTARPVARALRSTIPNSRILFSVTTDTGYEIAQKAVEAGEIDAVCYFPLDFFPNAVRRALDAIRPDAYLCMETELWPNFLYLAQRRGVHTFLVNGRVSDNLLKAAPRLGRMWRWMMSNLEGVLMRSQYDAERMLSLGVEPSRVVVTGDIKLDNLHPAGAQSELRRQWRQRFGIGEDTPLWVAGSTHPGEEEMVLRAYLKLREQWPDLRLIIAPRHIDRVEEVVQVLQAGRASVVPRSDLGEGEVQNHVPPESVILIDTVGELAQIYAAADVAFVGGSLIERGGHNMLEPVLRGVPVVFGPHIANFREAARLVQEAHVGQMVKDEGELAGAVEYWLQDVARRRDVPRRAAEALAPHSGATERVAQIVAAALNSKKQRDE
jgi:3-deoxy-D-manno-octulosonic-acid transferase